MDDLSIVLHGYSFAEMRQRFADAVPPELLGDPRTLELWERCSIWFRTRRRSAGQCPEIGELIVFYWTGGNDQRSVDKKWLIEHQVTLLGALTISFEIEDGYEKAFSYIIEHLCGGYAYAFEYLIWAGRLEELTANHRFYTKVINMTNRSQHFTWRDVAAIFRYILRNVTNTAPIVAQLSSFPIYAFIVGCAVLTEDVDLRARLVKPKASFKYIVYLMNILFCHGVPIRIESSLDFLARSFAPLAPLYKHFRDKGGHLYGDKVVYLLNHPELLNEGQMAVATKASMVSTQLSLAQYNRLFSSDEQRMLLDAHIVVFLHNFKKGMKDLYAFRWRSRIHKLYPRQARLAIRTLLLVANTPGTAPHRLPRPLLGYLFNWIALARA